MSYYALTFFMGLFGSLHCVVMCGPLVLALSIRRPRAPWQVMCNKLLYQLGRVAMYELLGLVMGFIGRLFEVKGWQQGITFITGILLVGMGLLSLFGKRSDGLAHLQQRLVCPLTRW